MPTHIEVETVTEVFTIRVADVILATPFDEHKTRVLLDLPQGLFETMESFRELLVKMPYPDFSELLRSDVARSHYELNRFFQRRERELEASAN